MELPRSVQHIASVIGRDQALKLVRALPPCGRRARRRNIYVPRPENLHQDHRLVKILGWRDASALARASGGYTLQPALCSHVERAIANRKILGLADLGYSTDDIAKQTGKTTKWVQQIIDARAMHQRGDDIEVISLSVQMSPRMVRNMLGLEPQPAAECSE